MAVVLTTIGLAVVLTKIGLAVDVIIVGTEIVLTRVPPGSVMVLSDGMVMTSVYGTLFLS